MANRPAAPPLKLEQKDAPGLAVTFLAAGAKPELADTRVTRLAAFYVPETHAPSPFVPIGPFSALLAGDLNMRLRDSFTFSAEGRGEATVTVNDKEVLKVSGDDFTKTEPANPIRLNKGKNKIQIQYKSPAAGDAAFRLLWTAKGENYADPVPPTAFTHNAGDEAVAKGERLREGRQLIADLRCLKCHTTPDALLASPTVPAATQGILGFKLHMMPELGMDAPDLSEIGARLKKDWIANWVNDPHSLRPTAHMPRLFVTPGANADAIDPRAADVAACLATLGQAVDSPIPGGEEKIQKGGQLFTKLHCIACHDQPGAPAAAAPAEAPAAADAAADEPPTPRIPLKYVRSKFQPAALTQFLQKPSAHYNWIGMPNFRFTPDEAEAVTAFLLSEANAELPAKGPAGDAAKGKLLIESTGCLKCHEHAQPAKLGFAEATIRKDVGPQLGKIPPIGWERGCLAADDASRKAAPRYELTEPQRQAIVAIVGTDLSSFKSESPAEFAGRQIQAMRCTACHARDGKESLLSTIYDAELKELEQKYPPPKGATAESFAPDQRAPLMTWFGEKLRPEWSRQFIGGEITYKPRPYLHARMPAFEARAWNLGTGLAAEHGVAPQTPNYPKPDPEQSAVGSKLAGKTPNVAFNCVQCHAIQKQPAVSPFEAPAVNFMHASERLRKDYYHRWIHNPLKVDPNTKMPQFERDDGTTTIPVYEGDARKQFEAIWQYLLEGKEIKPPAE